MALLESQFENILARYPDLIEPGLKLVGRQETLRGKRIDLVFRDRDEKTLVIEVKIGAISRGDTGQVSEYCHYMYQLSGVRPRGMLIGTRVPDEVRGAAEFSGFECKSISLNELWDAMQAHDDTEMLATLAPPTLRSPNVALQPPRTQDPIAEPTLQSTTILNSVLESAAIRHPKAKRLVLSSGSTVDDKFRAAFSDTKIGTVFTKRDIWRAIEAKFPEQVTEGGMLPQDRCYNITNAGLGKNRTLRIFEYIGRSSFRYLGENYPYNGKVTWKDVPCGEWREGILTKWENWPVLRTESKRD